MSPIEVILSFFEGLALIASPCILPILPLILSTSLYGGRKRPFGIILGFIFAFTSFALLSRELVAILHIDLDYIKVGALVLLAFVGISMLSETLMRKFSYLMQGVADVGMTLSSQTKAGFFGGIWMGVLIGLVWTPCAGPILAAALVQVIRQQDSAHAALLIAAFAMGAGLPMLLIALLGRNFMMRLKFLSQHPRVMHKILGLLILLAVFFIASGFNIQTHFSSSPSTQPVADNVSTEQPSYPAPSFAASDIWLNTPDNKPLTMDSLKGKVVLVDFWTYSCINCIRTLPYLNAWYKKYRDHGLVIVGVHAPEFEFEKNKDNVLQAIARYRIQYPVAMDNHLDTWTNFNNEYWPAHYLINKKGQVVYTHFGEGQYQETENNIRALLGLGNNYASEVGDTDFNQAQTPETYLGYARMQAFGSSETVLADHAQRYTFPAFLPANHWALSGQWSVQGQRIVSEEAHAKLALNFTAKHVYLVLGNSTEVPILMSLKLNGKAIDRSRAKDTQRGRVSVEGHRLYELIDQDTMTNGLLEIEVLQPGLEAYAFTFGQ